MAEDEVDKPSEGTITHRIVRAGDFRRYYADSSTATTIGSEIILSFLDLAPLSKEVVWQEASTQPISVKKAGETTELCSVRIDAEAASNLAFNLLLTLVKNNDVDLAAIQHNVEMIGAATKKDKSS